MIGFVATAYTNLFWMIGLGLLGETFYFQARLRYRPSYVHCAGGYVSHLFTLRTRLLFISGVSDGEIGA